MCAAGSQLKSGFACAGLLCSPAQNVSRVLPYYVCNTQARVEELLNIMQAALYTGMLARVDVLKRGRLQFASNQLFGRRFENCLRERTERPLLAGPEIINLELEAALRLMMGLLEKNSPRTVDARHNGSACMWTLHLNLWLFKRGWSPFGSKWRLPGLFQRTSASGGLSSHHEP